MGVFVMPSLGADMEAGRLVEWLVKPGDTVKRGDVVAVVETQKGAIEIEIFDEGRIVELLAELGRELPVGAPLATVLAEGETALEVGRTSMPASVAAAPQPERASEPALAPTASPESPAQASSQSAAAEHLRASAPSLMSREPRRASPAARQLAQRLGVDIADLKGSGPGGAILLVDVERAAAGTPKATATPLEEMRRAIASAMTRAKQTIPHFYLSETIDVDPAITFLDVQNEGAPPIERILLGALFVRAATLAAAQVQAMNGHYTEESGFVPSDVVNPGVAIALRGGGLVAPALMDAGAMTLAETMAGMRDLVTRARAGRLRASEMTQGTITVSSLGETGAEAMTGVIFPPQVALVGIGAPHLRPWVVNGAVVPRHVVTLTLSADHRVSDGRQAARFIGAFEALMQRPENL